MTQSTGISACLGQIERHPLWQERAAWKSSAPPFRKRGVGIAAVWNAMGYGRGLPDAAVAKVELTSDGRICVYNGVADMGQGNATAFLQIAGEILCQENTAMLLVQPDTDRTLPSGSASASRTTYTYGNALIGACEELRRRMIGRAAMILLADTTDALELLPGRIKHRTSGRELSLRQIAAMMRGEERVCIHQFFMPVVRDVPDTGREFRLGFPHLLFSFAAHLACVEVDELTGAIEIKEYLAATEAGRVVNPHTFEQQVQGAIAQGIGYALCEELLLKEGRILNPNFDTYLIPTACDLPEISSVAVEIDERTGPYGMKGVGEVGTNGPLPAIANAVSDACGILPVRSPLTAAYILAGIGRRESGARGERS